MRQVSEVAAKVLAGKELWEFEYGDQAFARTWGPAVVRACEGDGVAGGVEVAAPNEAQQQTAGKYRFSQGPV